MRITRALLGALSLGSVIASPIVTPSSDLSEVDNVYIAKRAASSLSVEGLESSIASSGSLSVESGIASSESYSLPSSTSTSDSFHFDFSLEGIAGEVNHLLVDDDLVGLLDGVLKFAANEKLVPKLLLFILDHNITREIGGFALEEGYSLLKNHNSTGIFVDLKNSGIVYDLLKSLIKSPSFYSGVGEIIKKFLDSENIDFGNLFHLGNSTKKREFLESLDSEFVNIATRDNINDLLTTILSSVDRSGLLEETVLDLVSNDTFQNDLVNFLHNFFANNGLSRLISGLLDSGDLLSSLWDSGLVQDTIRRAISDIF